MQSYNSDYEDVSAISHINFDTFSWHEQEKFSAQIKSKLSDTKDAMDRALYELQQWRTSRQRIKNHYFELGPPELEEERAQLCCNESSDPLEVCNQYETLPSSIPTENSSSVKRKLTKLEICIENLSQKSIIDSCRFRHEKMSIKQESIFDSIIADMRMFLKCEEMMRQLIGDKKNNDTSSSIEFKKGDLCNTVCNKTTIDNEIQQEMNGFDLLDQNQELQLNLERIFNQLDQSSPEK